MKISLALGQRKPLSRQTAWGCFTSNLALPGTGSLLAGRPSGYWQLLLALGGMVLSLVTFLTSLAWIIPHWPQLYGDDADPSMAFELMLRLKWPIIGIGLWVLSLIWGLATSQAILRESKEAENKNVPPVLNPPRR